MGNQQQGPGKKRRRFSLMGKNQKSSFFENIPSELVLNVVSFLTQDEILNTVQKVSKDWREMVRNNTELNLHHHPTMSILILSSNLDLNVWKEKLHWVFELEGRYLSNQTNNTPKGELNVVGFNRIKFFSAASIVSERPLDIHQFTLLEPCNLVVYQDGHMLWLGDSSTEHFDTNNASSVQAFSDRILQSSLQQKQILVPSSLIPEYRKMVANEQVVDMVDYVVTKIEEQVQKGDGDIPEWMHHNIQTIMSDIGLFRINPYRWFQCLPKSYIIDYISNKLISDLQSLKFFFLERISERTLPLIDIRLEFISYCIRCCHAEGVNSSVAFKGKSYGNSIPKKAGDILFQSSFFKAFLMYCSNYDAVLNMIIHQINENQFPKRLYSLLLHVIEEQYCSSYTPENLNRNLDPSRTSFFTQITVSILCNNSKNKKDIAESFLRIFQTSDLPKPVHDFFLEIIRRCMVVNFTLQDILKDRHPVIYKQALCNNNIYQQPTL